MRSTVDIDDEVLSAARTLASEQRISLGSALSKIARRGLAVSEPVFTDGLPTFRVSNDASPITPDMVREANEDQ